MFDVIAFDADDTLWHNETLFAVTQDKFKDLLAPYLENAWTGNELNDTEVRNLRYFGYGIKGFTLSMIETAIELTNGRVSGEDIHQIIEYAKEMLNTPVKLLDYVEEVIPKLAESHTLMIITKGDLFDQETKIAQSSLADYFTYVEIVSDKTPSCYRALLAKHKIDVKRFLMVGNSLRSDVLPVVELGGHAIHIPYHITWAHEIVADHYLQQGQYVEMEHIGQIYDYLERIDDYAVHQSEVSW